MATVTTSYEVAPNIEEKLRSVRTLKLGIGIGSVLLVSLAVFVAGMLLAMAVDWWTLPGNDALRPWLARVPLLASLLVAAVGIWRVVERNRQLPIAAGDVDRAHPELEERWSTLTETSGAAARGEASHPAMFRQLLLESTNWAPHVDAKQVVSPRSLIRAAMAVLATIAILLIPLMIDRALVSVLFQRFLNPSANITLTQLQQLPEKLIVAQGESTELRVEIGGRVADSATLRLKDNTGTIKTLTMEVGTESPHLVSHRPTNVQDDFSYQWQAGDAVSAWIPVTVAKRPKITAVRLEVAPPAYTKRPTLRHTKLPSVVRMMEGSRFDVAFRTTEPLDSLQLKFDKDKSVTLSSEEDGWYRWSTEATENFTFSPILTEPHGLKNRRPRKCRVQVFKDRAPTVKILSPTPDMAVRPDDDVEIHFAASDDEAIEQAEVVIYGESEDGEERPVLKTIPIELGDKQGQKKVRGSVTLPLSDFELESGESITYAIRVHDNRAASTPTGEGVPLTDSPAGSNSPSSDSPTKDTPMGEETPTADSSTTEENATAATDAQPEKGTSEEAMANGDPSSAELTSATGSNASKNPGETMAATTSNARAEPSSASSDSSSTQQSGNSSPAPSSQSSASSSPGNSTNRETSPDGAPGEKSNNNPNTEGDESANDISASDATISPIGTDNEAEVEGGQSAETENATEATDSATMTPNSNSETAQIPPKASDSSADANSLNPTNSPAENNSSSDSSREPGPTNGDQPDSSSSDRDSPGDEDKAGDSEATTTSTERRLMANDKSDNDSGGDSESAEGTDNDDSQSAENGPRQQPDVATPEGSVPLGNEDKTQPPSGSEPSNDPGDSMTRRMLDIPQSGTSGQQQLKVDEWAGSFEAQQREKLAIAISPILYELDELLGKAEKATDSVAGRLESGSPWRSDDRRLTDRSEKMLERGETIVRELQDKTTDTPYAFVGLQLTNIIETHVSPARDSLWEALQSESSQGPPIRSAWEGIRRARVRLAELSQTFDRIHREHRLAEKTERIKKMYRIFIEDAMATLGQSPEAINNYERRMAEFELDDEYLARLKEVLEMRRDLQAELARLLKDDPRLMRRFMDSVASRGESLRDQMTLLAQRQINLAREVRAWSMADEEDRPELLSAIARMRQIRLSEISQEAASVNERFVTWLPLDLSEQHEAFAETVRLTKDVAAQAALLAATSPEDAERVDKGRELHTAIGELDAALRRIDVGRAHDELNSHVLNRLAEVRKLNGLVSSWVRQSELLGSGDYWQEAAIEQYKLAMETDVLAGKLADLENQLSAGITPDDETATKISSQTRQLLKTLDTELASNQLAATFALNRQQGAEAVEKERSAVAAFAKIEKLFDELMRTVIDELDKIPPQDPIAQVLEDPTLDELLALLENELDFNEALGIPNRPSNLRIIQDWMQPNSGGGGGSSGRMISAELRREAEQARRRAERAHRRAVARALKEEKEIKTTKKPKALVAKKMRVEWNTLLSNLPDELRQGRGEMLPQEYRQMIEQYFSRISELENADSSAE